MLDFNVNLRRDALHLTNANGHPAQRELINCKFIPRAISITVDPEQRISQSFWRGLFSHRRQRLTRLKELRLEGFNDVSACHLSMALHDLNIQPERIYFNGVDVDECTDEVSISEYQMLREMA